jgi:predicted aspartyl protease
MGIAQMGKTLVVAKIENVYDLYDAERGLIPSESVHRLEVTDALVDTGATYLSMPRRMIEQLGLKWYTARQARTTAGLVQSEMYGLVRLTIQDRFCHVEVVEVDEHCPVLIGQLPLEALDFVVDPKGQRLIGNPEHGGQHMIDMF